MEKNNQKRSALESSKNTKFGYTIEIGNTTYENTLEERIQAAKNASSSAKLSEKQNIGEKLSKSRNTEENINVQNMSIIKSISSAQELKIKNNQWAAINKTDIQTSTHTPLKKNLTKTNTINSNFEPKCNTSFLKSSFKGGPMQLRLETIKANKKLSSRISHECSNSLESNNPSKNVPLQDIPVMKNHNSKLCNTNSFKHNEYKTRSTVQKHHLEAVKYTGHFDRTKDITNTPLSETIVSTKLGNQCISTNSKSKELLDSLGFVGPLTSCNQKKIDIKKNTQFNNDETMEWEDIPETDNIVEKNNDSRRTKHEYEPMEWTPDAIMHCDRINYCLVIDTNIFISDLKSITILIDKYFTDYGYPTIVLPWTVLRELDCIKNYENVLGYQARESIRWLLDMLSKRHPRLKGQPITKKSFMSSDDDILRCAMTVKERVNIVYLVTDDKILSIKSEVTGISIRNSKWLQNLATNTNQNSDIFQGGFLHP